MVIATMRLADQDPVPDSEGEPQEKLPFDFDLKSDDLRLTLANRRYVHTCKVILHCSGPGSYIHPLSRHRVLESL